MSCELETKGRKKGTEAELFAHHSSLVTLHCSTHHSSLVARHFRRRKLWPVACNLCPEESGQAQVEFVLSIVFVLVLIFGIFEMIMLLYTYNVLADSAKEGVRYAIVLGKESTNSTSTSGSSQCSSTSLTAVYGTVCSYAAASFHDVTGMSVTVNYPDGSNAATDRVQVQVSYPYKPLLNLGWPTVTINAAAEGRIFY